MRPNVLDAEITIQRARPIPAELLMAELQRELKMRQSLYPGWVASHKISIQTAAHRILAMEQLIELLTPALAETAFEQGVLI